MSSVRFFATGLPAFLAAMSVSCESDPKLAPPAVVRFDYLVEEYRKDPTKADLMYTGRRVIVPVTNYVVEGSDLNVRVGLLSAPPVLIFEFAEPPTASGIVWVYGICRGRSWDGKSRGSGVADQYKFFVKISDCQIGPPPTTPTF